MYDRADLNDLGQYPGFPEDTARACQFAILKDPKGTAILADSQALHPEVWDALFKRKTSVDTAVGLVARPLSEAQVDKVISKETRVRVLTALLRANQLTVSQLDALLALDQAALVQPILDQLNLPLPTRKRILLEVGGEDLLRAMAHDDVTGSPVFTDMEVRDLIMNLERNGKFRSFRNRSRLLQELLYIRPAMLDTVLDPQVPLPVMTAAGSNPKLTRSQADAIAAVPATLVAVNARRFALMALVSNPAVSFEVAQSVKDTLKEFLASDLMKGQSYEVRDGLQQVLTVCESRLKKPQVEFDPLTVDDLQVVSWMVYRALPSDYSDGRILEMLNLLGNPNVPEPDKASLLGYARLGMTPALLGAAPESVPVDFPDILKLYEDSLEYTPQNTQYQYRSQILDYAGEHLGDSSTAWETLVSLMDEYSGKFTSLVDVAEKL